MNYAFLSTKKICNAFFQTSGGMWYPYVWHAAKTPSPDIGPRKFKFRQMPKPEEHCVEDAPNSYGCKFEVLIAEWFTNNTHIPGEPTLPEEMYDNWMHRRYCYRATISRSARIFSREAFSPF